MAMGKQKSEWKSHSLVVNKDGKWMFKEMVEGGWGGNMTGPSAKGLLWRRSPRSRRRRRRSRARAKMM